jgi:hypothetical protein
VPLINGSFARCAVPVGISTVRPYTETVCKVSLQMSRNRNIRKIETAICRELELGYLSHQSRDGLDAAEMF